jgi:hypothetical protein
MVNKKKYKIEPIMTHLEDPEIRNPVSNPMQWYFEGGRRYVDGLFTGPPTLAMLYSVTGEDKYLQWMETCFWDIYGKMANCTISRKTYSIAIFVSSPIVWSKE